MTGNDVAWPGTIGSDLEVTFHRKSPGSGCRRPRTGIFGYVWAPTGCNSQVVAVTWQEMMSRHLEWTEVTRKGCYFTRSHLEVAVKDRKLGFCVRFNFYKAVVRRRWRSHDREWRHGPQWPEVTRKWRHLTGSRLEVGVKACKSSFGMFELLQGVTRRRWHSRDRNWRHVTSQTRSDTKVTSFD